MRDELFRLKFSALDLQTVPRPHAGFLIASCLAINDIAVFHRMFVMSLNAVRVAQREETNNETTREYALAQVSVIQRTLGAKLREYLYLCKQYDDTCARRKVLAMPHFLRSVGDAYPRLTKAKGYAMADWYRDKVTNHYILQSASELLQLLDKDEQYSVLLHDRDGNCGYLLGERALYRKFAGQSQEEFVDALASYQDWVLDAARMALHLHHEFCTEFLETFFPGKAAVGEEILVDDLLTADVKSSCLPLYWDLSHTAEKDKADDNGFTGA